MRVLSAMSRFGVVLALVMVVACSNEARDPRQDSSNIFMAFWSLNDGSYEKFLEKRRKLHVEAIERKRQVDQDNLILRESLSRSDAERKTIQAEIDGLSGKVAELERMAAATRVSSVEAQKHKATLDTRRDALNARAEALLASDPSPLDPADQKELADLEAERLILTKELEALQRDG